MKNKGDKRTAKKFKSYFSKEKKFSITSEHHLDKTLFPERTMMAESLGIQRSNLLSHESKVLSNIKLIKKSEYKNW